MSETYTSGVMVTEVAQVLVETTKTVLDNLRGIYKIITIDNTVIFSASAGGGVDYTNDGDVVGPNRERLLAFEKVTTLTYYATASTIAKARLVKVRPVPDSKIADAWRF